MMIEIHISSVLHEKIPDTGKNLSQDKWELAQGDDVQKVLQILKLDEIPTILMLNGRQADKNSILNDGDLLKIFAVLAGG